MTTEDKRTRYAVDTDRKDEKIITVTSLLDLMDLGAPIVLPIYEITFQI